MSANHPLDTDFGQLGIGTKRKGLRGSCRLEMCRGRGEKKPIPTEQVRSLFLATARNGLNQPYTQLPPHVPYFEPSQEGIRKEHGDHGELIPNIAAVDTYGLCDRPHVLKTQVSRLWRALRSIWTDGSYPSLVHAEE